MQFKMESHYQNNTWELMDLSLNNQPITPKWIYKIKYKIDGTIKKLKVRLVMRGFEQEKGLMKKPLHFW
jgi:hypothetical protein